MELTMETWLAELHKIQEKAPMERRGHLTAFEISQQLGWSINRTRAMLRDAMRDSRLSTILVQVPRIDGKAQTIAAYKVLPAKVQRA